MLRECGDPSALSVGAMDACETPLSKPTRLGEEVICQKLSGLTSSLWRTKYEELSLERTLANSYRWKAI